MGGPQQPGDGVGPGRHLFIVRIWREAARAVPPQWRGSVEHVPSHQQRYFATMRDLTDFITLRLSCLLLEEPGDRMEDHDEQ